MVKYRLWLYMLKAKFHHNTMTISIWVGLISDRGVVNLEQIRSGLSWLCLGSERLRIKWIWNNKDDDVKRLEKSVICSFLNVSRYNPLSSSAKKPSFYNSLHRLVRSCFLRREVQLRQLLLKFHHWKRADVWPPATSLFLFGSSNYLRIELAIHHKIMRIQSSVPIIKPSGKQAKFITFNEEWSLRGQTQALHP